MGIRTLMRVSDICTVNIAKTLYVLEQPGATVTRVVSYFIIFRAAFLFLCQRVCLGRNDALWRNTHMKNWGDNDGLLLPSPFYSES